MSDQTTPAPTTPAPTTSAPTMPTTTFEQSLAPPEQQQSTEPLDRCFVCLIGLALRGGEPIMNPGCGHQLHLSCYARHVSSGATTCGVCNQLLPNYSGPPSRPPSSALPVFHQIRGPPPPFANAPPNPWQVPTAHPQQGPYGQYNPYLYAPPSPRRMPGQGNSPHRPPFSGRVTEFTAHDPETDDGLLAEVEEQDIMEEEDPRGLVEVTLKSEYTCVEADKEVKSTLACFIQARAAPQVPRASTRPPCDVVAVLDRSGSMMGDKIAAVRDTLRFMVAEMGERDRLAIVEFDDRVDELTPLLRVTEQNRPRYEQAISGITSRGMTNIALGLRLGVDIMEKRREANRVQAIFFMSDGQDTAREDWNGAVNKATELRCPIYSFGFGAQHDSELLSTLAEKTNGSFNYVESVATFRPAMAGALGALAGQCVQDLTVKFACPAGHVITKVVSGNDQGDVVGQGGKTAEIKYADLIYGEKKVVVVETVVAKVSDGGPVDQDGNQVVLEITEVSFKPTGSHTADRITIDPPQPLTVVRPAPKSTVQNTRDRAVLVELVRCLVLDAVKQASKLADAKSFNLAQDLLQPVKIQLEKLIAGCDPDAPDQTMAPNDPETLAGNRTFYEAMLADTKTAMARVASSKAYDSEGGSHWMKEAHGNMKTQRATNPYSTAQNAHYQSAPSRGYSDRSEAFRGTETRGSKGPGPVERR